jgi:trehalose 6-phosphate synthase
MFHDYHLYLAPGEVRRRVPNALLHYLMHIPWPTPHTWHILPASMRSAICQSLCACDIVGFQSQMDAHNFLECCRWFVRDAQVDYAAGTVTAEGRTTRVRVYPLTIDLEEVRQIADSPRTVEYEQQLKLLCGDRTIIRVDRAEPNKNVVRGFRAYQLMLERHPELKGEVKFLAFLVPSRTHIKQYERYLQEIDGVVREVNAAQGIPGWEPITAFYENNYLQAIAGMKLGDVILVNPVSDGMSLVAKEGPIANRKDALMVLSEGTAAWEQLKEHALVVAPADIEGTATALYQAVTMPLEERARRASGMRAAIEAQNSAAWLAAQFTDIKGLIKTPA